MGEKISNFSNSSHSHSRASSSNEGVEGQDEAKEQTASQSQEQQSFRAKAEKNAARKMRWKTMRNNHQANADKTQYCPGSSFTSIHHTSVIFLPLKVSNNLTADNKAQKG